METLAEKLGYQFRNPLLLTEALTHPSLAYESQKPTFDNQRLEFLGDAVLQLILTEHLFQLLPEFPEGRLTKIRSQLVSRHALSQIATRIDLGAHVLLGRGEAASGGRQRASTLADALESLVGAIYLDGGLGEAAAMVLRVFAGEITAVAASEEERNPKGELQECLQALAPQAPAYRIIGESGPDHQRTFQAEVFWRGDVLGTGTGKSKKEAEAHAAAAALAHRRWEAQG